MNLSECMYERIGDSIQIAATQKLTTFEVMILASYDMYFELRALYHQSKIKAFADEIN
jgi:hypothetical protein